MQAAANRSGRAPKWSARTGPMKHVTVSKDHPVVVQVRPGHEANSAKMRNRLVRDQIRQADKLANTLDQMERASREVDKIASSKVKGSVSKPPFYPAPNKTTNPRRTLRQGSSKGGGGGGGEGHAHVHNNNRSSNACTADDRATWDTVDLIPTNLNEELTDFQAKVKHYQDQVVNLNQTVDNLRDDLDVEKAEAVRAEGEVLAAQEMQRDIDHRVNDQLRLRHMHGFPAGYPYPGMVPPAPPGHQALHPRLLPGGVPPYPYDPRMMAPGIGAPGPYNPFLNHLNAYGTHNLELRRMLQELELNGHVAEQRDLVLKQLSESELLNLQLKEDLATRDSENAALGQKVSHTGRLQKAFEDLQGQMKATKKSLQDQLKNKELECLLKEEEIISLKARSQIVVQSASDVKAATEEAVDRARKNAAADLAMTQAAVSNIAEAAEQRKKVYKSQSKEARRNLLAAEAEIKRLQVQLGETEAKKDEHHANHKSLAQKHDALHEHKRRLEAEHRVQGEDIASFCKLNSDLKGNVVILERQLAVESERAGDLGLQNADTSAKLEVCARRVEVAEARNKQLTTELTETLHVSRDTKDTLDQTRARLEEANSLVQRLTSQLDSSEKDREAYKQSSDTLRIELTEARHNLAELEVKAREQVQDLERELRKALEVTENLERIREDQQRINDAKIWDMKEQLDYCNTAKRSLQNYSNYVRSAYQDVFDSARI